MARNRWEADIGRFVDQERFELEKQKFFLERPQLIALTADLPEPGDYYATEIAGKPILLVRGKDGKARCLPQRLPPSRREDRRGLRPCQRLHLPLSRLDLRYRRRADQRAQPHAPSRKSS